MKVDSDSCWLEASSSADSEVAHEQLESLDAVDPDDVFIAVMGMTGAGKSTFISNCAGASTAIVGHGLFSCTSRVAIHTMELRSRKVHLIDTPGFDDDAKTDGDTLQEIAYWLSAASEHCIELSGIVYLQRITDIRIQGSALKGLNAFKKMCGVENYSGIVVASTMWDELTVEQYDAASKRQRELAKNYWKDISDNGGQIVPLRAGKIDAMRILEHIVKKDRRITLAFQRQIEDENLPIRETDVGKILHEASQAHYERLESQFQSATQTLSSIVESGSKSGAAEMKEALGQLEMDMKSYEDNMTRMTQQRDEIRMHMERKLQNDRQQLQNAFQENQRRLQEKRRELVRVTSELPNPLSTLETLLEDDIEALEEQRDELHIRKTQRLSSRYPSRSRAAKITSIVGTGLAVGQLVAAMACNVM